jgi:2-polyprenyl-3-methyl-5-hydroxy-6-metoxy-1,4-benzoquinol methylase
VQELREAVWDQLPEDLTPEHFAERSLLLLTEFAELPRSLSSAVEPTVLDAGCGDGRFAELLVSAGAHVIAVDAAQGALARARGRVPDAQLLQWLDGAPLDVPSESVDLVWAGEVLEHVGDGEAWLAELHRVLRPGGRLLLTTPNHTRMRLLGLTVRRRSFESHFSPWTDHLRFFTKDTLRELLDRAGFAGVEIQPRFGRRWMRATLVARAVKPA